MIRLLLFCLSFFSVQSLACVNSTEIFPYECYKKWVVKNEKDLNAISAYLYSNSDFYSLTRFVDVVQYKTKVDSMPKMYDLKYLDKIESLMGHTVHILRKMNDGVGYVKYITSRCGDYYCIPAVINYKYKGQKLCSEDMLKKPGECFIPINETWGVQYQWSMKIRSGYVPSSRPNSLFSK